MKIAIIVINVLAILLLGAFSAVGPLLAELETRMGLTQLDRADCFKLENLKKVSSGEFEDPRGRELANYLTGSWRSSFGMTVFLSMSLAAVNILLLLVPGTKSPGTAPAAPGPVIPDS